MEHSSHAHPLPDGPRVPSRSSMSSARTRLSSSALQELPSVQESPQARRMNIRHRKFLAPLLPARRTSPLFGLRSESVDTKQPLPDTGYSCHVVGNQFEASTKAASPSSILQEIHNSTRKRRQASRNLAHAVFEDAQSMDTTPFGFAATSWCNEKNNENTPPSMRSSPVTGVLREGSYNARIPADLTSPSSKSRRPLKQLFSENDKRDEQIEHLESQLASATARIDALTSPKAANMRSVKMRALTAENRNLKAENAGWARKAEEMLEQERWMHRTAEAELKNRSQELKEELELKGARIAELEWEVESMVNSLKEADGLVEANAKLGKRIDILSEIIARSPSKMGTRSSGTSPRKHEAFRRTARPLSMVPRLPTSPATMQRSFTSISSSSVCDSRNVSAPAVQETSDHRRQSDSGRDINSTPQQEPWQAPPSEFPTLQRSMSSGERSQDSNSFCSAPSTSSRAASFMSASSTVPSIWDLPAQVGNEPGESNKQRRMRRFPSGSVSLKPLILPSTSTIQSLPASAPLFPSIESVTFREVSGSSVDSSSTSYITQLVDYQTEDTPTAGARQRRLSRAREQTLGVLEGKATNKSKAINGDPGSTSPTRIRNRISQQIETSKPARTPRPRTRTLQEELDRLQIDSNSVEGRSVFSSRPNSNPLAGDFDDGDSITTISAWQSVNSAPFHSPAYSRQPLATSAQVSSSDKGRNGSASKMNARQDARCEKQEDGMVYRLIDLIVHTKQTPVRLARRIVANAWAFGSSSLGGIAWWLIGPLYHYGPNCTRLANNADLAAGQRGDSRHYPGCTYHRASWKPPSASGYEALQQDADSSFEHLGMKGRNGISRPEPHLFACPECVEPGSRRTMRMWFRFCLTVVLAVGMAVKHGPGALIVDIAPEERVIPEVVEENDKETESSSEPLLQSTLGPGSHGEVALHVPSPKRPPGHPSAGNRSGTDSGYGSIVTTLSTEDFEDG